MQEYLKKVEEKILVDAPVDSQTIVEDKEKPLVINHPTLRETNLVRRMFVPFLQEKKKEDPYAQHLWDKCFGLTVRPG